MKKLYKSLVIILGVMFSLSAFAQDELVVAPGLGTLNDAIEANGGSKIYVLEANGVYILDAPIEHIDYHLIIKGQPYDDETWPATVQTGTDAEGAVLPNMFSANGDLTLENLYIMNVDANGQVAMHNIMQNAQGANVTIHNCIIDPMGQFSVVNMPGGGNSLFMTDNICLRHGHQISSNDGHAIIITADASPEGADTVIIQNNTWVDMGMNWFNGTFGVQVNNFILIDHNTFVHSKSQMDWSIFENEYYFTNNLFFDFMTSAYSYAWQPMPGGDAAFPKPGLIYADTIPGEVLPTDRISYVQYNTMYHSQGFYDIISDILALDDSVNKANLHPLIWDGNTPAEFGYDPAAALAESREAQLFNHSNNTNDDFPMFKYGNITYDVDPGWTDATIYDLSDSLAAWQRPATWIHGLNFPASMFPDPPTWAKFWWDPDGDIAINDAWPVFDGTYTNAELLTGSVANYPLGDLNWFPDKKAEWEAEKDDIFAHMKAGNTSKYGTTSVEKVTQNTISSVYPNPVSDVATIRFSLSNTADVDIKIYNSVGQEVQNLFSDTRSAGTHRVEFNCSKLKQGVYYYSIKAGDTVENHKFMVVK